MNETLRNILLVAPFATGPILTGTVEMVRKWRLQALKNEFRSKNAEFFKGQEGPPPLESGYLGFIQETAKKRAQTRNRFAESLINTPIAIVAGIAAIHALQTQDMIVYTAAATLSCATGIAAIRDLAILGNRAIRDRYMKSIAKSADQALADDPDLLEEFNEALTDVEAFNAVGDDEQDYWKL